MKHEVAIVGSGPAALMAADVISAAGHAVRLFEKRKNSGRKLLVAGSSGLNITNSLPLDEFVRHYSGGPPGMWTRLFKEFFTPDWIRFIEQGFGISTFEGTSGRYFVEDMKASRLLKAWTDRLAGRGAEFRFEHECVGFERREGRAVLRFANGKEDVSDAALFCLGGASWEPTETPLRWPPIFKSHGLGFTEFTASNVGYQIKWAPKFLEEAEGQPLKNIVLSSSRGSRKGEAMVTKYGMEGTPVYAVGTRGPVKLDLKPDLTFEQILAKLQAVRENLAPIRRVKKQLNLGPAAFALLFHHTPPEILKDPSLVALVRHLKALPLEFLAPQPLTEAISSAGGLQFAELSDDFMLKKEPGFFAAGEMLDWDTVTGGFLIQACVSQGHRAGQGILRYLSS